MLFVVVTCIPCGHVRIDPEKVVVTVDEAGNRTWHEFVCPECNTRHTVENSGTNVHDLLTYMGSLDATRKADQPTTD